MSDNNKLLNAQEVSVLVGSSVQTITSWYKWKSLNPNHELAQMLPDYTKIGNRRTRYWTRDDVWKLIEFKQNIPVGRYGLFGEVTQKYVKNSKWNAKNKKLKEN